MQLTRGTVIAGRYRLESKIGEGGMGSVWLGEHVVVGVRVAVKTLLPAAACDHEVAARFRREARLLGRISSDHVARVLDFIEDQSFGLVLVMEYVEGRSLTRVLHEAGTLQIEDAVELAHDIVSAIGDMHRAQIVHRDLKPGNILIQTLSGGRRRAVIVDFGMSRLISQVGDDDPEMTGITRADMALGTLEYMAPEAILNSRDVTVASDLYAVGAILYRALAGQHVFANAQEGELARAKLMQDAPPLPMRRQDRIATGLAAIVARSLRRRVAERYQRAEDMLADLTPLRELVRVAAVQIETAETHITSLSAGLLGQLEDSASSSLEAMEKTRPLARNAALGEIMGTAQTAAAAQGSAPSHLSPHSAVPEQPANTSAPHGSTEPLRPPAPSFAIGAASAAVGARDQPTRTGMPYGFAATAILLALSAGVIVGAELNRRGVFPFRSGEDGATSTIAERPSASSRLTAPEPPASPPPPELIASAAPNAAPSIATASPPPAPQLGPSWPKPLATATADTIPASASRPPSLPAATASAPAAPTSKALPIPAPPTAPPRASAGPPPKDDPYQ